MSDGYQPVSVEALLGIRDTRPLLPPSKRKRLPLRPLMSVTRAGDAKPRYRFRPLMGLPFVPQPGTSEVPLNSPYGAWDDFMWRMFGTEPHAFPWSPYRAKTANSPTVVYAPPKKP